MKSKRSSLKSIQNAFLALSLAFSLAALSSTSANAADLTWDADATFDSNFGGTGNWDTSLFNWSGGGPVDEAWATNTTAGDTAVFSGTAGSVTLGTNINALGLTFTTPGYTIELASNILALGTGGINATALSSGTTTINGPGSVGLAGNQTWDVGSGSTLELFSGVNSSTAGTKILTVQGAGNTTLNGAIAAGSGAMNLTKLGTGTLTLSGGGALGAGSITAFGGTNSAVLLGGTTNITGDSYTSAGEFVVGGVLANGGPGVDTNLVMDGGSLTVNSFLSLGRGNGTGTVTSNIVLNNSASITSNAFSAGYNNNNGGNTPRGSFTLNDTSIFTINGGGNFFLGESAGSDMTLTVNDTAILNRTGGATLLAGTSQNQGALQIGRAGKGTVIMNGGTINTASTDLGRGVNNATAQNGTLTIKTGATYNNEGDFRMAFAGGASGQANLNLQGGTLNIGTTTTRTMVIGTFDSPSATVTVDSGNLNLNTDTSIRFNAAGNTGAKVFNLNGGSVTSYSDNATTANGSGVLDMMQAGSTATNTFNLNGGALTIRQVLSTATSGTRIFNFNGGTLKATGDTAAFFNLGTGTATANVRNGGAVIDTNGFNVTVAQALQHSNIGADNAIDGGLAKQGGGALILSGANTYNGDTFIDDGSFTLANTGSLVLKVLDGSSTQIFGDATNAIANFDGLFRLDLSAVTVSSGSWSLVNVANLTETFGATFSLIDDASLLTFAETSDVWTAMDGEKTWTFTEATGLLQVVPEPGAFAMMLGGLGALVLVRRRR